MQNNEKCLALGVKTELPHRIQRQSNNVLALKHCNVVATIVASAQLSKVGLFICFYLQFASVSTFSYLNDSEVTETITKYRRERKINSPENKHTVHNIYWITKYPGAVQQLFDKMIKRLHLYTVTATTHLFFTESCNNHKLLREK